jgi:hypothetical protein
MIYDLLLFNACLCTNSSLSSPWFFLKKYFIGAVNNISFSNNKYFSANLKDHVAQKANLQEVNRRNVVLIVWLMIDRLNITAHRIPCFCFMVLPVHVSLITSKEMYIVFVAILQLMEKRQVGQHFRLYLCPIFVYVSMSSFSYYGKIFLFV